jgi:Cu+-exporting ATPase
MKQTDPVCGMAVDENSATAQSAYKDKTYFFCALNCKKLFEQSPEAYINKAAEPAALPSSRIFSETHSQTERMEPGNMTLPIAGMSCASCVSRIEKGLSNIPGVSEAKVNFPAEKATVAFDPSRVNSSGLVRAVKAEPLKIWAMKPKLKKWFYPCRGCPVHPVLIESRRL